MELHPLLREQVEASFGSLDSIPRECRHLIRLVDKAYADLDARDRFRDPSGAPSGVAGEVADFAAAGSTPQGERRLRRLREVLDSFDPEAEFGQAEPGVQVARVIERLVEQHRETERELRRAKQVADAANRAKTEFLANMSHEIRTPLNAVVGMISLLEDTAASAQQRDYLETVRQNSDALLDTINAVLDFSRIEAGELELENIPCDLSVLTEQVVDTFIPVAAAKNLDLAVYISPSVPDWVLTDPTRLRQVLVNLVGNALKFTHRGGIGLLVDAQCGEAGWRIDFTVEDTGIGIPEEHMNRLFKSFAQVDPATTRHYGGSGLGLAISQRLVALMGGEIKVRSEVGRGSLFRFNILAEEAKSGPAAEPATARESLDGLRVLVVDDLEISRRILERQLSSWGLRPRLVCGSRQALEVIREDRAFDLVILDFNMPGMDGAELALEMDRLLGDDLPPIVLLSSSGQQPDIAGSVIRRRLAKPVRPQEFRSNISELLLSSQVRERQPKIAQKRPSGMDPGFAAAHPLSILVAEDVAVNRKVVQLYLMRLGYKPHCVVNGREAVEAVAGGGFDLVLMDLQMPVMDGGEATRQIRARASSPVEPYIIALTANVFTEQKREALEAGMQAFLGKPLRPDFLVEALAKAHETITELRGRSAV